MRLPHKISLTEVQLQDQKIELDSITEEVNEALFKMEEMTSHSYEKDDIVITDFTLEMNMNKQ